MAPKRQRSRTKVSGLEAIAEVADSRRAPRLIERAESAAGAFADERYQDARRILAPIAAEIPNVAVVRELMGLTLYKLGRWKDAIRELEAFDELTNGSAEQHPVLADCHRALGHHAKVNELWLELKDVSPSPWLVAEGRIVAAGDLADQGRLADAIRLLEGGWRIPKRVRPDHLRRAYALADLRERAGDLPGARALFGWIVGVDPTFADAVERLAAAGS